MTQEYNPAQIGLLSAKDFDVTIAQTFEPAPNGLTVALAYEGAVERVLGEAALEMFRAQGLGNRAAGEIVADLAPMAGPSIRQQHTEDIVLAKLDLLYGQVGKRLPDGDLWPRITGGYKYLSRAEYAAPGIDTAVVSSGHERFIRRFFEVHELPEPEIIVTDDDMRPLAEHIPAELCVKPGRLILDLAHYRWLEKLGLACTYENIAQTREHIVYSGDDPIKDGQLAENTGVRFVHIDPDKPKNGWRKLIDMHAALYIPLSEVAGG